MTNEIDKSPYTLRSMRDEAIDTLGVRVQL